MAPAITLDEPGHPSYAVHNLISRAAELVPVPSSLLALADQPPLGSEARAARRNVETASTLSTPTGARRRLEGVGDPCSLWKVQWRGVDPECSARQVGLRAAGGVVGLRLREGSDRQRPRSCQCAPRRDVGEPTKGSSTDDSPAIPSKPPARPCRKTSRARPRRRGARPPPATPGRVVGDGAVDRHADAHHVSDLAHRRSAFLRPSNERSPVRGE